MLNARKHFGKDESGGVTVDWVVLTAALVGLGIVVIVNIEGGVTNLGDAISSDLSNTNAGYQNQ